jgi:glycosyltransferase involved in cell wall biosynthesis
VDILKTIRAVQPDLVMNVTALPVLVGSVAAALARNAVVVNVLPGLGHLFATPQRGTSAERWLVRAGFRWVASRRHTALVFQLEADRDKVVPAAQPGRERLAIIPGWGVDVDRFDLKREEASPPQVVLVARMLWEKGVSDFVEAARQLRSMDPPARFVIVGRPDAGNPGSISVAKLDRWKDDGSVEWWGWRSDIPELLSRASLLVLPTRYGEGVPRVLVEAAAAGLPVVASDVPGCRAIVQDGISGWLVPVGDVARLVHTIGSALQDPLRRRSLGEAGRRVVRDRFSVELVVELYSEVFRSLGLAWPWRRQ